MFTKDKKYITAIKWLSQLILGISLVIANESISIEFGEVDSDNQIVPILYNSSAEITGFQFFIIGMDVTNVFGGTAEENNFYLHQGSTCWRDDDCKDFVTGFSMSGSPIPAGFGTLFYLNYAEIGDVDFDENISVSDLTCLDITEGFILGSQGNTFEVNIGECMSSPIDCIGNYYGSAFYDDCGICSEGASGHDANSDMDCLGTCFGDAYEDACGVCDTNDFNDCFTYTIELQQGANLISFHALPTDISVSTIFSSLGDNAEYIIGEGGGAFNQSGIWYGSLQTISAHSGYWLIIDEDALLTIPDAVPTNSGENNLEYNLHPGNNLISYPFSAGQDINEAIDVSYQNIIFAIAGSGVAAQYVNGIWYGSLDFLNPSAGYWMVAYGDGQFQFNQPDYDAPPRISSGSRNDAPDLFTFTQSPYQAFYWVADADIDGIPMVVGEDWIGAFYGDVCIGAREWSGMSTYGIPTDIPVMGFDDAIEATQNYIVAGEYPRFVVYDASEDKYYDANAYDNHIFEGALLAMYSVHEIKVERDCQGELGGHAYEDNCGVCDSDPENDCPFDCYGVPGGEAFIDDCGICSGGDTGHVANSDQDDCGDCFGDNADMDCNGDCGLSYGSAYFDDCGVCSGGYSGHLPNSDQDCNGDCFGTAYEDDCSVCSSGESGHTENTDKDCNGDCFGEAIIDDCGECSDGLSGHPANSDKDCFGDCFGLAFEDDCGVCSEGESGHNANSDQDCNGDCFGDAYLDDCDVCSGGLSNHEPESDQDCAGECFGPALIQTYYFDNDGDGLGGDTSEAFCNTDVIEGWVSNHADIDDNCTSNYHDCMDVCDGTDMVTTYYQDNDGDGLGSDISDQYCSGEVPEGWVSNSSDPDDDCTSNNHDCAGVCDGDAFTQTYWNDNDGDGLGSGTGQQYCTTEVPDGWVLNDDDFDDDCYSNYHDCAGVCNGFSQVNTYFDDEDGDGLGYGEGIEFCNAFVPDHMVTNNVDEDDNCYSNEHDCAGLCDGDAVIDECGDCGGDNSSCVDECGVPNGDNSSCMDECGVPNGDNSTCADCAGVPNGSNVVDNCGTCDGDISDDCVQDCAGEWGGEAVIETYYYDLDDDGLGAGESSYYCNSMVPEGWVGNQDDPEPECSTNDTDDCGVCGGDNSSCADCTGVPNGDAVEDNCGVCDNDPTNDCPFDCADVPGGNAYLDDCGMCSGGNTEHNPNSDMDQCGVCFGNNEDQQGCGCFNGSPSDYWYDFDNDDLGSCTVIDDECLPCEDDPKCESFCGWDIPPDNWIDNTDDTDDNCYSNIHDCAGTCDGDAVVQDYWQDADSDGLGSGDDTLSYCSAIAPEGWVPNNYDEDDDCYSNIHDCMGVCDGIDTVLPYYFDNDGDNLGSGNSTEFCSGDVPDGWVDNNDDEDDECFSNVHDCADVCDGDAITQTYWNDNDGDGLGDGIEQEFCSANVPIGWVLNSDDEDDNCYSNYHDCAGDCNGFAQINTYYFDNDGDDLGYGIDQDFCDADVPDNWVLNNDDPDDECFSNIFDCADDCDGEGIIQTYWNDDDGDELGNGITEEFCSTIVPDGWVLNNDDPNDDCFSNIFDCADVCDGDAVNQTYWNDDDGDGLGNGIEQVFCSADVPEGWVLNNDDIDDNCFSNIFDCAGVCDGDAVNQTYWNDDDGDGLGNGIEQVFCSADVPEGWVLNNDDIDDNCFSNIFDCAGVCDGDAVNQTYWNDDDGDGLGNGIDQVFCSANVPEGWVLNNDDIDDNCFSNMIDQCGVCNGDDSTCSGCPDPIAFNYNCYAGEIPPCNNDITLDDESCIYYPDQFIFNQSQMQAFYIVENAEIQQEEIENLEILTDWIGVFKDGVCVGAYPWTGSQTTIPAMGYDGSSTTENYLETGDYPAFYIFDSSEDEYMSAAVTITDIYGNEYNGWGNFEFFIVEEMIGRGPDCSGMELGTAFIDDCGICICGYLPSDETLLGCLEDIPNIDLDCSGVCEPSTPVGNDQATEGLEYGALIDNCGVCSEGSTGHPANSDELGCGCFNPAPEPFWLDIDSDGFGYGETSYEMCSANATDLYADNNLDLEPSCPNPNPETSMIDNCGDCVGVDVTTPNENMDVFGTCCNADNQDLCGVCFGDDSSCNQPVVYNQSLEILEDYELEIILSGFDPNNDHLIFSISDEPSYGSLSGSGQNWNYLPNLNFNGLDSFTFTASDGSWTSGPGTITIQILAVNDIPEATDVDVTIAEDGFTNIDLLGIDADEDNLSYILSSPPIHGSATLTGSQVLYTPDPNYNGMDSFTFTVSDGEYTSQDGTVNIIVNPVPDAPYLSSIQDTSIIEGESFSYSLNFGDADGDELFLFVQTDGNSNAEIVDGTLFVTPQNNYFGDIQVTITASDGEFDVNQSFTLTVIPINDPPDIINLTDQTILEDSELTIELNASDPDGDDVSFNASASENAEVIISGNILNIIPTENFNGDIIVTVSVTDGEYSASQIFTLTVLSVNDAPEIISSPLTEAIQGINYEYIVEANDGDGDELSFGLQNVPSWLSLAGNILSGMPSDSDVGDHNVVVTVTDGELADNQSFTISVVNLNDLPTVSDLTVTVLEDSSVTITLLGEDIDGDDITFSISSPPLNGSVELESNEAIYTPNQNYNGNDSFGYTANDGEYTSAEGIVNISVSPIDDPPSMAHIPDMEMLEGDTLVYSIEYSNIDGEDENILFFAHTEEGSTGNEADEFLIIIDGILIITPPSDFNGDVPITIEITDGIFSVSESFVLTVIAVNDPPILAGINDQEINEDSELIVELLASDIDGDELTFYVNPVSEALMSIENNYLTLTPVLNYFGDVNVLVSVSDGEFVDSTEFSLNVLPVNDAPELINNIENISVNEGAEDVLVNLIEIFYDVENGSELAYSVSENVNGLSAVISESVLTLSFEDENFGSGVVGITASDNISRATVSTSFNVEIIPVNDPPIVDQVSVESDEDTSIEIALTASDPESDNLEYSIVQSPENGSLTLLTGSTYEFAPNTDYFGSDSFIFQVSDGENQVDETAIILINAVNDNPYFITESFPDALENSEYEANILIDDIDNEQSELSLFIVSGPNWLELNGFTLGGTPGNNDAGNTDVTLELSDGFGSVSWTADLFVENSNSPPVVENLSINVEEDSYVEFTIYASDPEGGEISYNLSNPANGTLTGTAPDLIYTPDSNFYGEDVFTFTAFDGELDSDTAWVNIQIIGINDNPVAGDLIFEVDQSPYPVDFSSTVFDPDGDDLTIITVPPSAGDTLNTIFGGTLIPIDGLLYEYIPPTLESDADFMLYKATDGTSETGLYMVTFNLYGRSWSRSFPPTAFDDNINIAEDEVKEITMVGFDVFYSFPLDGSEYVTITQAPQHGNLENITFSSASSEQLAQWTADYIPNPEFVGTDIFRYTVHNPNNTNGASNSATITISVSPVNDLPRLDALADVQMNEDSGLEVYFYAYDSDNDLEYNVSSSNESITVSIINDSTMSILPLSNYNGSGTITLTATEIGGDELSTSQIFTVDVLPVNDAPTLTTVNDISFNEDEATTISLSATDVDYESFTYSAASNSDDIQVSVSNNLLTLSSSNDFYGNGVISISVVDNEGAEDSQDVSIEILPVNDAPVLDAISDLTLPEDTNTEITLGASDVDSQELVFSASASEHIAILLNGNILSITPASQWSGSENITITVSDGELSESTEVTVTVLPLNDPPILSSVSNQEVDEDNSIDVFLNASDSDGDYLTYSVVESGGMNATLGGNVLTLTPPENYYGEKSITISVTDGEFADSTDFTLTVNAVNDAPIVSQPLEDVDLLEDTGAATMVLSSVFSDIEGDELFYNVSLNSNDIINATIVNNNLIITTLSNQNGGPVLVTVTGDDQQGGTPASDTFIINVSPVNDSPSLSSIENQEINEGSYLFYSVNASDVDGDNLVFSAETNSEASINFTGNILSVTPDSEYNGDVSVTVTVSDGEYSDSTDFTLTVKAVNDAPIVSQPLEDIELLEDSGVAIMVLSTGFSDVDGDSLVYDASFDVDGIISIETNGNILTISTLPNQYGGPVTITVTADDQQGASPAINKFEVIILPVNDAPIANEIAVTLNEDGIKSIIPVAEDIDSPFLEYIITQSPAHGTVEIFETYFNYSPEQDFNGEDSFAYQAFDGELSSNEAIISISIDPVNDRPVLTELENQFVEEGQSLNIILSANDVDGDDLIYSVSSEGNVNINLSGNDLVITALDENFNGEVLIAVEVSDGEYIDSDVFNLEFTPVNDPPTISAIENQEINEDGLFLYSIQASDVDGDQIEITIVGDSTLADFSVNSSLLSVTPIENFNGEIQLTVFVSDSEFADSTDFTLTVKAVNDAPIVSQPLEDIELLEDSGVATMVLSTSFIDVDGDSLVYDASFDVDGIISIETNGNILTISTLPNQYGGPITITVSADDLQGSTPAINQFEVIIIPVNDPPIIISIPDSTAWEDTEYIYHVQVEDVDNDLFYYNLGIYPDGMVIGQPPRVDSTGIVTWTPIEGVLSSGLIMLFVWDKEYPIPGVDEPAIQTFSINVTPVNDPPVIISAAPPTATEDELYSYQVLASDPDDIEFEYSLSNHPEGMNIDSTGIISWTPLEGELSSGTITVLVNDGGEDGALPAEQDFFIVVIPVNDPPVIISTPPMSEVMVSDTFYYQILVEDVDDDEFSFVLIDSPAGMTIDETGYLSWVPQFPGEYGPITILVSDGGEDDVAPAAQAINILVTPYTPLINYCLNLYEGANLKSFYALPEDVSVSSVMSTLGETVMGVITEGGACSQISPGVWVGSQCNLLPEKGYWIITNNDMDLCLNEATLTNPGIEYNIYSGANLISFPSEGTVGVSNALPDDIELSVLGVITEGGACSQISNGNWVGSQCSFKGGMGYWMITTDPFLFSFDLSTLTRSISTDIQGLIVPDDFKVYQSTRQAFYFIEDIFLNGNPVSHEDWILAYYGNTLIGSRQWNGEFTDLPAMGTDGRWETDEYSDNGNVITLKVLQESTGEIFKVIDEIPKWEDNGLIILGKLIARTIPTTFDLGNPYPNPFNPVTNIAFDIPNDCNIELSVYDLRGRLVETLLTGYMEAGSYDVRWNAGTSASGVYFLRMMTPESAFTRKLILMK